MNNRSSLSQMKKRKERLSLLNILTKIPGILGGEKDVLRLSAVSQEIQLIGKLPPQVALKVNQLLLSMNGLATLNMIDQFKNLDTLYVANNDIRFFEDILQIKSLGSLKKLALTDNPITALPYYKDYVLFLCSNLIQLDGRNLPAQSIKRQQILQEAKLNYQKLMNFLSKCIYNEMRNLFIINLVNKRIMHLELLPRVLKDHLRITERIVKQPLATVLRLLRGGEVFNYIISSNEKFFSKVVQVKCPYLFTFDFI
jgi:hypothetical protein